MSVIHEFFGDEGVDQGFNRGGRRLTIQKMSSDLPDHGLIGKLRQLSQSFQVFQIQSRMTLGLDHGEIVPGGLHKDGFKGVSQKVGVITLDRGVASAM